MPKTRSELDAVLRLLNEPDAKRAELVISNLTQWPGSDIECLRQAALGLSEIVRRNVQAVHTRVRFSTLNQRWQGLASQRRVSLEQALLAIAQSGLLECDEPATIRTLDHIAEQVGARLSGDRAFDMGLNALATVLHIERGLIGNEADFYNPLNSYLPSVLERGLGIPISLGAIAILVGQRLDLPVFGIGTPGHFLCFYGEPTVPSGSYFDPFAGFTRVSRVEVEERIRNSGAQPENWMFSPANEREIVARTLRNLIAIHRTRGDAESADLLLGWLETLINHGQTRP